MYTFSAAYAFWLPNRSRINNHRIILPYLIRIDFSEPFKSYYFPRALLQSR
jgi:hypothetical protein